MKKFFGLAALVLAAFTFTLASCKTSTDDDSTTPPTEQNGDQSAQGGDNQNGQDAITFTTINLSTITGDEYTARHGEALTGTLGENVKISIAHGATVTLKDMSINAGSAWTSGDYAGITCEGDATIVLSGTNTVKSIGDGYPGIYVPAGKTLTIQGEGSLAVSPRINNAGGNNLVSGSGIGGGYGIPCGNIVIEGGTINAIGGNSFAGIGGGKNAACGNITISGGNVTAQGADGGAGIGSGQSDSYDSSHPTPASCGDITITGGTVSATGGNWAAGIGTGSVSDSYNNNCGTITISGGTVTATGGAYAAGIGTGRKPGGVSGTNTCTSITITGGTVTATKGDQAQSIGAGQGGSITGTRNITVNVTEL